MPEAKATTEIRAYLIGRKFLLFWWQKSSSLLLWQTFCIFQLFKQLVNKCLKSRAVEIFPSSSTFPSQVSMNFLHVARMHAGKLF